LGSSTLIADADALQRGYKLFALNQVYRPTGIGSTDLDRLDPLIGDKRLLKRREAVFRQGDASHSLYIVRSGSLKTFIEDSTGDVQVLGFHLPGEVVGVGGLGRETFLGSAEALERSHVWALPQGQLLNISDQLPALQQQLMQMVGRWADTYQEHLVIMGKQHAVVRLAMFLRSFASRYKRLSRDPTDLLLPMSRRDLGSYLGLAMETVSRAFSQMEAQGVLAVDRKEVHILHPELLADLCGDGRSTPALDTVK